MKIIGLGSISPLGSGKDHLRNFTSRNALLPVASFGESALRGTVFYDGSLSDSLAKNAFDLACASISEALLDSGITSKRIALVVATGAGETDKIEQITGKLNESDGESINSHGELNSSAAAYTLAEKLARQFGFTSPVMTVSNACASSGYGLAICEFLLTEAIDAVILCGVEAKSSGTQATFKTLMVLDQHSCRPFAENRNGTVLGAGAAAIVLVKGDAPGKREYARIAATTTSCDAFHVTAPDPAGAQLKRCIREALTQAECSPDDVKIFIPHATGTPMNDAIETGILEELFPASFFPEQAILVKKYIGHTGGASAAFSVVAAALALANSSFKEKEFALVSSCAFGGNNSCSLLYKEADSEAAGGGNHVYQ